MSRVANVGQYQALRANGWLWLADDPHHCFEWVMTASLETPSVRLLPRDCDEWPGDAVAGDLVRVDGQVALRCPELAAPEREDS